MCFLFYNPVEWGSMMFKNLFDLELERRGYKTVQQKADACGVGYEPMRQILKGKHPSDERITEIAVKLNMSQQTLAELLIAKSKDRAKEEPTRQAWGYLEQLIDQLTGTETDPASFRPASLALKPDTNLTDDEKLLVTLYRRLFPDDRAEIRGEIRGMLKAEKYQDDPGSDLKKVG